MKTVIINALALLAMSLLIVGHANANEYGNAQGAVVKSEVVLQSFMAESNNDWFTKNLRSAKAVLFIPQMLKGGFVVGGSGGTGVLLSRDFETGEWSYPVYYSLASVSVGLQIGAEASQVVMLVMTEKGMDSLLSNSFKLGADASIAAGPVGAGAKAATADILAYAQSKGAFGGVSVEGALVKIKADWNAAYYKEAVSPADVIIRKTVSNPDADNLREALTKAAKPGTQTVQY